MIAIVDLAYNYQKNKNSFYLIFGNKVIIENLIPKNLNKDTFKIIHTKNHK